MEFHVIELPKLPEELKKGDRILAWAKFINAERREEFEELAGMDTYIEAAYNHLQVISQDDKKRMEYEARQKAIRDYNEGMLESHERGRKEGKEEEAFNIAKKLLAKKFSLSDIVDVTGLTIEQIQHL